MAFDIETHDGSDQATVMPQPNLSGYRIYLRIIICSPATCGLLQFR
jgi:hypothetical protein